MNDVDNNLYYKKHMLNLQPSLLNFGLKKRKWATVTGTGILCLIIAETETIISAVTGLLVTAFVTTDLSQEYQSSLPTHSGCQESQCNLVLKIH